MLKLINKRKIIEEIHMNVSTCNNEFDPNISLAHNGMSQASRVDEAQEKCSKLALNILPLVFLAGLAGLVLLSISMPIVGVPLTCALICLGLGITTYARYRYIGSLKEQLRQAKSELEVLRKNNTANPDGFGSVNNFKIDNQKLKISNLEKALSSFED
jgi:hypothetical protein